MPADGSLFDPARARGAPRPSEGDREQSDRSVPLRPARLAELITRALTDGLPKTVRVIGEVSGFRDRTHWYFDLKDADAVISCACFAQSARRQVFTPRDGQEVIAAGRIDFFARQGKTQLYVESITPVGEGALELRFRALCDDLRARGWFDPGRKRPLPVFPRKVAVITSRTGAALQDVLDTARRRCPAVDIAICDALVQGPAAAASVVRAMSFIARHHERLGIDAVILTRGGGSMEDLWTFNEVEVARAVLESPIPVVCAIGHETDVTIAELVADERCATPTQAAMRLTPDRAALAEQTARARGRLDAALRRAGIDAMRQHRAVGRRAVMGMRHLLASQRVRLAKLEARMACLRPEAVYAERRARLAAAEDALRRAALAITERRGDRIDALERELAIASPLSVLARGYSVTTRADGSVVRAAGDAPPGEAIITRLADGTVRSIVTDGVRDAGRPRPAAALPPRRPAKRKRRAGDDQPGLF